jgi:hypothetical protein
MKSVLETAHAGADITCMCFGRGDKKLSVRHLGGADGYCLARYPNSGPQHANDCIYYAPDPSKSGLQGYAEGVVTEIEDGGLRVRLGIGLRKKIRSNQPRLLRRFRAGPARAGRR